MNHSKIPQHQSIEHFYIIQIEGHFFRTPDECDASEYPEYFAPEKQAHRFDPNDPDYEYSQLTTCIEVAHQFSYTGRVTLPKYTLDEMRYWGADQSEPKTLNAAIDHFKRVYQTNRVRPVICTRTVTYDYGAPPYPPNE